MSTLTKLALWNVLGSRSSETVHIPSGAYVLADSGTDPQPGRNKRATVVGGRSNNSLHYIYIEPYECSEKINECQLARPHTHHFRVGFQYSTDLVCLEHFQVFRRMARRPGTESDASASLDGLRPIGSDFRLRGSSAITVIQKRLQESGGDRNCLRGIDPLAAYICRVSVSC